MNTVSRHVSDDEVFEIFFSQPAEPEPPRKPQREVQPSTLPNLREANRIPHAEVLTALFQQRFHNGPNRCPFHDDGASPSLAISARGATCFGNGCPTGGRLMSNVDMVMRARHCDERSAGNWLRAHFPDRVGLKLADRRLSRRNLTYRAGVDQFTSPRDVIRAGFLSALSDSETRVYCVLAMQAGEDTTATLTYEQIRERSGRSKPTIAAALRELQRRGLVFPKRRANPATGFKAAACYDLRPDQEKLLGSSVDISTVVKA